MLGQSRFETNFSGGTLWVIYLGFVFSFGIGVPFVIHYGVGKFLKALSLDAHSEDISYIQNISDDEANALADGFTEAGEVLDAISNVF